MICAKGIEQGTGKLLSQVVTEVLPKAEIAVLSGPSFAAEIARGLPAAVTLATSREAQGSALSHALSYSPFRCYWSDDVIGAEIGGAVKNVYAIAAGIVAGKKFGESAHAALVTRGFAEMARFGMALGARRETLAGLSGLGDLVLTCGSPQSRNMSLGIELGKGTASRRFWRSGRPSPRASIPRARLWRWRRRVASTCRSRKRCMRSMSGLATVDQAIEALLARPLRPRWRHGQP